MKSVTGGFAVHDLFAERALPRKVRQEDQSRMLDDPTSEVKRDEATLRGAAKRITESGNLITKVQGLSEPASDYW